MIVGSLKYIKFDNFLGLKFYPNTGQRETLKCGQNEATLYEDGKLIEPDAVLYKNNTFMNFKNSRTGKRSSVENLIVTVVEESRDLSAENIQYKIENLSESILGNFPTDVKAIFEFCMFCSFLCFMYKILRKLQRIICHNGY